MRAFTPPPCAGRSDTARRSPRHTWYALGTPISYASRADRPRGRPQHAQAVENLLPFLAPGARVLDVGSGSGYLSAVLHHLVQGEGEVAGAPGRVVAIEHIPELVGWSVENLRRDGLGGALDEGAIKVVEGDGRKGASGYPFRLCSGC